MTMKLNWLEIAALVILALAIVCIIAGFIHATVEKRQDRKIREDNQRWQLKSKEAADSER